MAKLNLALSLLPQSVNDRVNQDYWTHLLGPKLAEKHIQREKQMDKQIRKIEKTTKKAEKELKSLEKADKRRDKTCDYGAKMLKKKKAK